MPIGCTSSLFLFLLPLFCTMSGGDGTASIPLKMKCSFPPRLFPHTFSQVVSSPTPKLAFPQQPKKIVVISPTMAVISPKHKYFYVLGIVLHCKVHIKTLSSHSYTVLSYKNSCTYYFLSHKHKPVLL